MMVISLPKDILALNLCTEKNLSIFCAETVRRVTLFFTMEIGNPFLPSILKLVSGLNSGVYVLMY